MAETSRVTYLGMLGVGSGLIATYVISAAVVGSIITKGDVILVEDGRTTAPSILVNTTKIIATASGAMTATGGAIQDDYDLIDWSNPSTETGSIDLFEIYIGTTPSPETRVDCVIQDDNTAGTGTGGTFWNNLTLARGVIGYAPGTGTGDAALLIGPNARIRCLSSQGSGQLMTNGTFRVKWHDVHHDT